MTIDGVANDISAMMMIKPVSDTGQSSRDAAGKNTEALTTLVDEARLSSLSPRLQSVLHQISEQGGNALEMLENNVTSLQNGFLETLQDKLAQADVSLDAKLTLKLDDSASLKVAGDHPQRDAVQQALDGAPELGEAFREIASQSELIRDIGNIRKVLSARGGAARYAEEEARDPAASVYQISLKGAMSHFCFARKS